MGYKMPSEGRNQRKAWLKAKEELHLIVADNALWNDLSNGWYD